MKYTYMRLKTFRVKSERVCITLILKNPGMVIQKMARMFSPHSYWGTASPPRSKDRELKMDSRMKSTYSRLKTFNGPQILTWRRKAFFAFLYFYWSEVAFFF